MAYHAIAFLKIQYAYFTERFISLVELDNKSVDKAPIFTLIKKQEIMKTSQYRRPSDNKLYTGVILIVIGLIIFLRKSPLFDTILPYWLFTWPSVLILVGLFIGVRERFKNISWIILIGIGVYAHLWRIDIISMDLRPYLLPLMLIIIGVIIVFRNNERKKMFRGEQDFNNAIRADETVNVDMEEDYIQEATIVDETETDEKKSENKTDENYVNVNSVFGSVKRVVITKQLSGADVNATFAAAKIHFNNADFNGVVIFEMSAIFGSIELIIPSNWKVQNEVSVVLGSLEDNRVMIGNLDNSNKLLIIKGNVFGGSIEIRS